MDQATVIVAPQARRVSLVTPVRVATLLVVWALWEAIADSGLLFRDVVPSSLTVASALGATRFAGKAFEPYLHYLAPTPKIVFLPILLVLFGIGPGSKIAMGTLSCFFPMALSVAAGVREVDAVLLRVGRSFNLTLGQTIRKIYLPSLVPPIATGLKLGLGVAIIGCLLAEIKMSNRGLGFLVMQYYAQFRVPYMYAALIVAFAIAALGNALIARFVRLPGRVR